MERYPGPLQRQVWAAGEDWRVSRPVVWWLSLYSMRITYTLIPTHDFLPPQVYNGVFWATGHEWCKSWISSAVSKRERTGKPLISTLTFTFHKCWHMLGWSEWSEWKSLYFGWRISRTKVRTLWIRTTWRWWKAELYIITYWKLPPLSTSSHLHFFTPPPSPTGASHHYHLTCAPPKLALIVATPSSGGPTRGKLPLTKFSAPQWWRPPQTSLRAWEHQIPALFYQKMTHCTYPQIFTRLLLIFTGIFTKFLNYTTEEY